MFHMSWPEQCRHRFQPCKGTKVVICFRSWKLDITDRHTKWGMNKETYTFSSGLYYHMCICSLCYRFQGENIKPFSICFSLKWQNTTRKLYVVTMTLTFLNVQILRLLWPFCSKLKKINFIIKRKVNEDLLRWRQKLIYAAVHVWCPLPF